MDGPRDLQNRNIVTDVGKKFMVTRLKRGVWRINWEIRTDIYTVLHIQQTTKEDLLCSTGWGMTRTTEDEMTGWHHWLDRHEFEQVPGVGDGQGSLVWYSPWGCKKVRHDWVTELNWTQQSDKFSVGKFQVPTCIFQFLVRKWELRLLAFSVFLSHSQVF